MAFSLSSTHAEWGLYKMLEYMGLHEILPPGAGKNRAKLRKDIEEYHIAYVIDFDDSDDSEFPPKNGVTPKLPSLVAQCL